MRLSASLIFSTAEAVAAARQVVAAFDEALRRTPLALSGAGRIEHLAFNLTIAHPVTTPKTARASGGYDASDRAFYAKAALRYAAFIGADWPARVEAVGQALRASALAVHKTRLVEPERSALLALIAEAQRQVASDPPETLFRLEPVELIFDNGQAGPGASFGSLPLMGAFEHTRRLRPEEIDDYLRNAPVPKPAPSMFKRYRRSSAGHEYREAWPADGRVIEHWGLCGQRGETREHPAATVKDQSRILRRLKAEAAAHNFKPIPRSRHAQLVVQRAIVGMGTPQDLDERHALEAFLDEVTGWLGLGCCDGGSIGAGSMEAFCFVVDAEIARAALASELAKSDFRRFAILPA